MHNPLYTKIYLCDFLNFNWEGQPSVLLLPAFSFDFISFDPLSWLPKMPPPNKP